MGVRCDMVMFSSFTLFLSLCVSLSLCVVLCLFSPPLLFFHPLLLASTPPLLCSARLRWCGYTSKRSDGWGWVGWDEWNCFSFFVSLGWLAEGNGL